MKKKELIIKPDEISGIEHAIEILEELKKPIEKNKLKTEILKFQSVCHFAFGDQSDREIAMSVWAEELINYPGWAIKYALKKVRREYTGKGTITIGRVVEIIDYITGDHFKLKNKLEFLIREGKVFRSHDEYMKFVEERKEFQRKKIYEEEEAKKQNEEAWKELRRQQQENIEKEKRELEEKKRLMEEREKKQKESMRLALDLLSENKNLHDLYKEFCKQSKVVAKLQNKSFELEKLKLEGNYYV